jgi:hypothetical protein
VSEQFAHLGSAGRVELVGLRDVVDERARDDRVEVDLEVRPSLQQRLRQPDGAGGNAADVVDEPFAVGALGPRFGRSPRLLR